MIDFDVNLFEDIGTFNMLNPALGTGISNVNFWAYKNVLMDEAWAVLFLVFLVSATALMLTRVFPNHKEQFSYLQYFMNS